MMKVQYVTGNGRLTFEFESETDKKLVESLAHIQEIFEEPECGCCKSKRICFEVREFEHKHYKMLCEDCGATIDFGQNKSGDTLFTKRLEKETRNPLPNKGWYRYAEGTKPNQQQQQQGPKPATMPSANSSTKPARPTAPPLAPKPAPKPATAKEPTIDDKHTMILNGYREARTVERVDEWVTWAGQFSFAEHHDEEQSDEYHAAIERITGNGARTMAAAGAGYKDIPF